MPRLTLHRGHPRSSAPPSLERPPIQHPIADGRVRAEAQTSRIALFGRVLGLVRGRPGQFVEGRRRLAKEHEGNGHQGQAERAGEDQRNVINQEGL